MNLAKIVQNLITYFFLTFYRPQNLPLQRLRQSIGKQKFHFYTPPLKNLLNKLTLSCVPPIIKAAVIIIMFLIMY